MRTRTTRAPQQSPETLNHPPALEGYNAYTSDRALQDAAARFEAGGEESLAAYGALSGDRLMVLGTQANENRPRLRSVDRAGRRIDVVEYHPAYHELMAEAIRAGIHNGPWSENGPSHVHRAILMYLHNQAEAGTSCPLTMTFSAVPALRRQPEIAGQWLPGILSSRYDPRNRPAADKAGLTIGMAMTEKQGGSDVRTNITRAEAIDAPGPGQAYRLDGHKWFCSAPMSDAFLVLARTDEGPGCFLMPRWRPDGTRNGMHIQRLKDKVGNWANASSEIELDGAWAALIGEPGRGVRTIIDMVAMTRFDCLVGSASLMRQAVAQAVHWAVHRRAFGRQLIDQPLMRNVLADLSVESEAALLLAMRVARALDRAGDDPREARLARLAVPLGKYWVCKRTPALVNEAQECLGGAGYVEDFLIARLYREAPLNSIWEGSGNIQCLDILRVMDRDPECLTVLDGELERAGGRSPVYDRALSQLRDQWADADNLAFRSRYLVERLAVTFQAALLVENDHPEVAEAFLAGRLDEQAGLAFGTLPSHIETEAILRRARPDGPLT